jgi:NADPH-dependent ferric siderophore reductase
VTQTFASEATVAVADAAGLAARFIDHMAEHDVACETAGARTTLDLGIGFGVLEAREGALKVSVEADDLGKLELLRSYVSDHIVEFAEGPEPAIAWRGHAAAGRTFADFREVRLVSAVDVAPRIRRLTFTGEDIARFGSEADLHVRLYFPPEGLAAPEWPRPGPNGRTIWPAAERRPEVRYYTVRRWRPERNEIDVDVVLHDDEGPGSAFAARALPGATCGMAGPLGRGAPSAGWTLLAGDETALPAIARILERMDRSARGVAFIEVDCVRDEIVLDAPSGVAVRWLHRRGAPAGTTSLLLDAVAAAPLPPEADPFAWVACEYGTSKAIRAHLRAKRGLARDRHLVVGYWEREAAEKAAA